MIGSAASIRLRSALCVCSLLVLVGAFVLAASEPAAAQDGDCDELTYNERIASDCPPPEGSGSDADYADAIANGDADAETDDDETADADDETDADELSDTETDDTGADEAETDDESHADSDEPADADEYNFDTTPDPPSNNLLAIVAIVGMGTVGALFFIATRRTRRASINTA